MPRPVIDAIRHHLDLEITTGGYEAAAANAPAVERAYGALAQLLNGRPDEIALIENATRAWDMAFYALARTFRPGDRIVTAEAEYASNYVAYLQAARDTGVTIDVVPSDDTGALSVDALAAMMDARVKLIAITHVPTNGGLVNPAAAVGAVARTWDVPYLLDACQSAGQMPLDVARIGCTMLSGTGRKYLRGPRGTGFLWVRADWIERLDPPMVDLKAATWDRRNHYVLRPDARRFENWESFVAGRAGLAAAVDYALGWGLEAIEARIATLAARLRDGLAALPGVTVTDLGDRPCGIVTFTHDRLSAEAVRAALAGRGINVSVSKRSSTRLDMERRGLPNVVRASVHYYNSEDEVDRMLAELSAL
ncbi:MAG: aminotransferase class V-fold PLP-dependent enzyme [Rhodobacterales bacterium]|nr:aminotransferase class V-fold PLP-dependent enzyme [Rhodobacterales bacterium]